MNVNITLPTTIPLAVNPPTESARRDNIQRPQIIPPQEMSANPSSTQVGGDGDHARSAAQSATKNAGQVNSDPQGGSEPKVKERSSGHGQQSGHHSGQGQSNEDSSSSPFQKFNLDALLNRAKNSQDRDRDYYHRAPPGAPKTPEEVQQMRLRNQVIARRYESSYQQQQQAKVMVTI